MCTINDNQMIYGSWDEDCNGQKFLSFENISGTFTHLKTEKSNIWKNWKKTLGDIITLHMRTIHENHMTYGSWYMERTGHNFLWFWTILCPFTPLTTQKIKTFKKGKKPWRYDAIILHMPLINDNFLSSWTFFAHLPP